MITSHDQDATTEKLPGRHERGLWWTFAAALVLGVAIIVAIAQNSDSVRVHYIVWSSSVSLIVVVLTTALTAILLDQAGGLIWRRRRRARIGRRDELARLRTERSSADEAQLTATPAPAAHVDASPGLAMPAGPHP